MGLEGPFTLDEAAAERVWSAGQARGKGAQPRRAFWLAMRARGQPGAIDAGPCSSKVRSESPLYGQIRSIMISLFVLYEA